MVKNYKESRFNIEVEIDSNHTLIYNSLSQGFSLLEENDLVVMEKIKNKQEEILNNDERNILDHLLLNNFIIPSDIDEGSSVKKFYFNERNKTDNMGITILPTLKCNFDCSYCFEGSNKEQKFMQHDVQKAILNLITNKAESLKSLNITWFGGEPLMGFSVIKDLSNKIIPFCDSMNLSYFASVITNGYLLNKKVVEELYIRKVRTIQITLDGDKERHDKSRFLKNTKIGSYDKIMQNISDYLDDFPISTILRVNVDNNNKESIFTLIDNLSERGFGKKGKVSIYFAPIEASTHACSKIVDDTINMESFANLELELYKYSVAKGLANNTLPYRLVGICTASRPNGYVILPNGDIHRCWETVSDTDKKTGILSNGYDAKRLDLERNWSGWSPFMEKDCVDCKILPNCAGYCAYRFIYKREFNGHSKVPCPALKYNIKGKLKHFAALQDANVAKMILKN